MKEGKYLIDKVLRVASGFYTIYFKDKEGQSCSYSFDASGQFIRNLKKRIKNNTAYLNHKPYLYTEIQ